MRATPAQLSAAVTSLIADAGTVFDSNANESGRWLEFALAAEALAGTSSSANATISGYMLRAAVALEYLAGITSTGRNTNYFGYLNRIVTALESLGIAGTGSLGERLRTAADTATLIYTFTNAEASAVVDRMTTKPNIPRKQLIDDLVGSLKTDGVWAKLKVLYVLAGHNREATLLNWIADDNNCTVVGSPTFTADAGWRGTGAANHYLATGFIPSVDGGMLLNDCHLGLYRTQTGTSGTYDMGMGTTANRMMADANTGGTLFGGTANLVAGGVPPQHVVLNRDTLNTLDRFVEGALGSSVASTPGAVSTGELLIGCYTPGVGTNNKYAGIVHAGTGLTDAEVLSAKDAFNTYLTEIGAL